MARTDFELFAKDLQSLEGDSILALIHVGSDKGIKDPLTSDIDLIAITREGSDLSKLYQSVQKLEKQDLGIHHSPFTFFLQRHFMATDDFFGIHFVTIPEQNFSNSRLKLNLLSGLFVSERLLLNSIQTEGSLIFGDSSFLDIKVSNVTFADRLVAFTFPLLMLLAGLIYFLDRDRFVVWNLKALKIHLEIILNCSQIQYGKRELDFMDLKVPQETINLAVENRYSPQKYQGNRFLLMGKVLFTLVKHLPFIFGQKMFRE